MGSQPGSPTSSMDLSNRIPPAQPEGTWLAFVFSFLFFRRGEVERNGGNHWASQTFFLPPPLRFLLLFGGEGLNNCIKQAHPCCEREAKHIHPLLCFRAGEVKDIWVRFKMDDTKMGGSLAVLLQTQTRKRTNSSKDTHTHTHQCTTVDGTIPMLQCR